MGWLRKQFTKLEKVTSDDVPKKKRPVPKTKTKVTKYTGKVVKEKTEFQDEDE